MQTWISIKSTFVGWTGLDSGAVHVLASFVTLVVLALLLRRPLTSLVPVVGVLVVELINEAVTGFADGVLEDWELAGSMQDVALVMVLPALVLLTFRMVPQLLDRPNAQLERELPQKVQGEIVDAEFEEL